MTDTTTITPEERKMFREDATFILAHEKKKLERIGAAEAIILLLNALEQAEARAEKAETDKAVLEEDLEATEKSLKESSGFIEELLSGLKLRFPAQYTDLEGDEYGDDAFSSHDLFELVIDPAVNAAQEAEAENTRLTKMVDWLAEKCAMHCRDKDRDDILCSDDACDISSITCFGASACDWKEAASRAVAESEVKG